MDMPVTRDGVDAPTELQRLEMSIQPRSSASVRVEKGWETMGNPLENRLKSHKVP